MKTKFYTRKSIISIILAVIMICSLFTISVNALTIEDNKAVGAVSSSYAQFLNEKATNEEFAQIINAAEKLGVEFCDINELNFSEEEMNNLPRFDTGEEFLAFIENIQRSNTIVISESDIINSIDDNTVFESTATALASANTTISKWAPSLGGLFVWQNISFSYDLEYFYGRAHISNVNVIDSWYGGATFISRTHLYGGFDGVAWIYPEVITVPEGTVQATGRDTYGIEILGLPIGVTVDCTFEIYFAP